jgi:alkanesulfonate monooxygenase SsuD/methylene tetrahydromethanopterin reductase-like flavin-dependent oxidoreductase (luciferase family)
MKQTAPQTAPPAFEFPGAEVVGTPDECLARIAEMESWGVNYLRVNFQSEATQDSVARLLLPRLAERVEAPV